MHTPSIEARLSRKQDDTHPFAKRVGDVPVIGFFVRGWIRATRADEPQTLWAPLPPVAIA